MRRLVSLALVAAAAAVALLPASAPAQPERALGVVVVTVSGNGTVTSSPPGINCPFACIFQYPPQTQVTLTAIPGSGAVFTGWGGDCSGNSTQCSFDATNNKSVTASFGPAPQDADQDGYSPPQDCNDSNAAIHPGAAEVPGNSVDENCDGVLAPAVDADGDGSPATADCNDSDPAIHPGATEIPGNSVDENCDGVVAPAVDADGDGSPATADCNDTDAAVHPGATEILGNGVDENCDGVAAPFPVLEVGLEYLWTVRPASTLVRKLDVVGAPLGATVRVGCIGAKKTGCPFKQKTLSVHKAGRVKLGSYFEKAALRSGATIEVRVTKPASIGKQFAFSIRKRKVPARTTRCVPPGGTATAC